MIKKKMLPVGIESFEDIIRNGYYYIDKTGLLAELLANPSMVNLFTRPRRFGKSLNMSMLRCFFETGSDPHLFDGLKIAEETELFEEYMGRFPVIAVSLKGIEGTDYGKALAMFKGVIHAEFLRHSDLMDSDILDQYDKNILASERAGSRNIRSICTGITAYAERRPVWTISVKQVTNIS